jgi:WD40 repeat protein
MILDGHVNEVNSLAFSPDGKTLASASTDRSALLWDVADPATPRRLGASLEGHADEVRSVVFHPDGRTLATASADRSIILWDVTDREHPARIGAPLLGHTDIVQAMAFSPDGAWMTSVSYDTTGIIWPVASILAERDGLRENPADHACERVGRGLRVDEWQRYVPDLPYRSTCEV